MIRIINTLPQMETLFEQSHFQLDTWKGYINKIYPESAHLFLEDMEECLKNSSFEYEKDILPVIESVVQNPKLKELEESFQNAVERLEEKIRNRFGKTLDLDIVLYLGLCNGAGWVTEIQKRDVILLGIEKIIELDWVYLDEMYGLIYHELGHVYHKQHGSYVQNTEDSKKEFVWQLFTEGIAMYFEQSLLGDDQYYHQDKDGWKIWCDQHFHEILRDFDKDLPSMSAVNQKYFGDWVSYQGRGDVGYYLGTRFVQALRETNCFDDIIQFDIEEIYDKYRNFVEKENKE